MVKPSIGTIVLVPFPFSDLSKSKVRPALVVADAGRDDLILCQITSKPWGDPLSVEISKQSFISGELPVTSYARPGKLFTAHVSLFIKEAGRIDASLAASIIASIIKLFRGNV